MIGEPQAPLGAVPTPVRPLDVWANEPTDYLVAVLAKLEAIQQEV